jgi:hypothetical protein
MDQKKESILRHMFMASYYSYLKVPAKFSAGQGKSIAPSITFRKKTEVEWTELSVGAPVASHCVPHTTQWSDKTIQARSNSCKR